MMQLTINYQRAYNWIQMLSPLLLCTSVMSVVQLPMQLIKRKQLFPHVQCPMSVSIFFRVQHIPACSFNIRVAPCIVARDRDGISFETCFHCHVNIDNVCNLSVSLDQAHSHVCLSQQKL